MKFPFLFRKELDNQYLRDNFQRLIDYFTKDAITRCGFMFIEITASSAVTTADFPHGLGYEPKDMIIMSITGGATVTVNYDRFTDTYVNLTTSAATTIRALIGRYNNG